MSDKKESIAVMKRKIERLEAKVAEAEKREKLFFDAYRETSYECVDYKIRIEQALRILNGEES